MRRDFFLALCLMFVCAEGNADIVNGVHVPGRAPVASGGAADAGIVALLLALTAIAAYRVR